MEKLKKFLMATLFMVGLCVAANPASAYARTLHVEYLNGDKVQSGGADLTIDTSDTNFDAVKTAVEAELGGTDKIIAYVAKGQLYRGIFSPNDAGLPTDVDDIVVVTNDAAKGIGSDGGELGDHNVAWFIKEHNLYIVATGASAELYDQNGTPSLAIGGPISRTLSYPSSGFYIKTPSMEKGDVNAAEPENQYGMYGSEVGDERTIPENTYYTYKENPASEKDIGTGTKADVVISNTNGSRPSLAGSKTDAGTLPWVTNHASEIEEAYLGPRITIKYNLAQFFNGHTTDDAGHRYSKIAFEGTTTKVDTSLYTSLRNVYIYSDLSQVTSLAAAFARCPELTSVLAFKENGTPYTAADPIDLTGLQTTAYMFYGCPKLTNNNSAGNDLVNCMNLSTGSLVLSPFMFAGCSSLSSPVVSEYNMSNVENIDGMFMGVTNANLSFATSTTGSNDSHIDRWDTSSLLTAQLAFKGTMPMKGTDPDGVDYDNPTKKVSPGLGDIADNRVVDGTVDLAKWDLNKLVSAYHMFAQNLGVTGVTFDTGALKYAALKDAAGMFNGCDNLSLVTMDNVQMPALKYAHAMFRRGGSKATSATASLKNWSAEALENIDHMFEASGFSKIDFEGSSDMHTVKEARAVFADNAKLSDLGTGNLAHWLLSAATNTDYMFSKDTALQTVDVSSWGMGSVESISHMFSDCSSLTSLGTDGTANWTTGALADMECFAYGTKVLSVSMAKWDTTKLKNMYMAFANNSELTEATLPEVTNAFALLEDANGAFYNCPKLTKVEGTVVTNKYAAPNLLDARGMFANDVKLVSVKMPAFVKDHAKTIAYMFRNCEALEGLVIDEWDTSACEFMQGLFDGCKKISAINVGANFKSDALINMGEMFRNCYELISPSAVIEHFTATTNLTDMYHTFENDYKMATLDISHMDLSKVTDLRHLAYMAEKTGAVTNRLATIKVPDTIMTAAGLIETDNSDGHGTSINMFWVDGDGGEDGAHEEDKVTDDLLTTLFVNGEIPAKLKAYNFGGANGDNDNRAFITDPGRTINGVDTGAYTFISPTDKAILSVSTTSKLYKNGTDTTTATNVPATYKWEKGSTALTGNTASYTTGANEDGVYHGTALPGELTGSNTSKMRTFTLSAFPVVAKKIEATYTGPNIVKGNTYSKDNVTVEYTDAGGVKHTLASADWSVDSLTVPAIGENTFTASYDPGDGALTDTFKVTGVAAGEPFISAVYIGEEVKVGDNYDKADVKVVYTKADGTVSTLATSDFLVSGTKVTSKGDNTFTATYIDPDGKTLTDTFDVEGVEPAKSISATYKGNDVPVGSNYSKDDVEVVVTLSDGTKVTLSPDDFKVDSQKVTKKGDNTFTATFNDGIADYTDTFTVKGLRVIGSIVSTYNGPAVLVGSEYDKSNVTTMAYWSDDTSKSEGFEVTPTSYSTTKVNNVGANNITATYKDPDQNNKAFTSTFRVNGYKNISSIGANYTGDKVKVGDSYDKNKVKVTVYYDDGTSSTVDNFTVDSTVVTGEGSNSYTATYRDSFGNTYTAGYTVPGYKDSSSSSSSSSGTGGAWNPNDYAGVSSVWPGIGTGYAKSTPVGLGVASGIVQTGTTHKASVFVIVGVLLVAVAGIVAYIRFFKSKDGDDAL